MEESLYYKIAKETMESEKVHNETVDLIKTVRENQIGEASIFVEAGRAIPFLLYREYSNLIKNIEKLCKFDNNLPKYEPIDFVRALIN